MWTKNGKKYFLKTILLSGAELEYTKSTGENITWSGIYRKLTTYQNMNSIKSINSTTTTISPGTGFGVFCGSGDTPPTEDDYTLAEPLSLDYIAGSITETIINKVIQYTVQNNNTEAVTIRELGLCLTYYYPSSLDHCFNILLNRKLLDTPITLEVGEQAVITFTVDTSNIVDGDGWTNVFKIHSCNQFLIWGDYDFINTLGETTSTGQTYSTGVIASADHYGTITSEPSSSKNKDKYAIYVGIGTTPTTGSDYTLESPVDLTYQDATCTIDNNNNGLITYTLQNTSTETYTISEICLVATQLEKTMINRKLLPTPVVMEPNDSYVFTYTINTSNLSE